MKKILPFIFGMVAFVTGCPLRYREVEDRYQPDSVEEAQ